MSVASPTAMPCGVTTLRGTGKGKRYSRRRNDASERFSGHYVHTHPIAEKKKRPKKQSRHEAAAGYRPKRKTTT